MRYRFVSYWLVFFAFFTVSLVSVAESGTQAKKAQAASDTTLPFISDNTQVPGYVELDAAGKKIDAAYLEETLGQRHGAVLLLPDEDESIDSQGLMHSLRYGLLKSGWSTLSVNLTYPYKPNIYLWPGTETGTKAKQDKDSEKQTGKTSQTKADKNNKTESPTADKIVTNQQRISAALAFLTSKGIKKVIILGHGQGGVSAAEAVSKTPGSVAALILVATPELQQSLQTVKAHIAVADFYGNQDLTSVLQAITNRRAYMHNTPENLYISRKFWGADHDFYGVESQLVLAVRNWLRVHFVKKTDQ